MGARENAAPVSLRHWPQGVHRKFCRTTLGHSHRIHGAAIYGNMDPINIPP